MAVNSGIWAVPMWQSRWVTSMPAVEGIVDLGAQLGLDGGGVGLAGARDVGPEVA